MTNLIELTGASGDEIIRVMAEVSQDITLNPKDYWLASQTPGAHLVLNPCTQGDLLKSGLFATSLNGSAKFYCSQRIPLGFYLLGVMTTSIGQALTPREKWIHLSNLRLFYLADNPMGCFPNGEVLATKGAYSST